MNESIQNITNGTISALLGALISTFIGKLISSRAISMAKAKGAVKITASAILKAALSALPFVICFWFLFSQLITLLGAPGPASRVDIFMISFWTFWLCMVFLRLLSGRPLAQAQRDRD